jgi:cell wall-associated protease
MFGSISPFAVSNAAASFKSELPIGTRASGEISEENGEKIYKIDLSEAGGLTINVSSYFEHMDVQLHDFDGEEIWDSSVLYGEKNNPKKWSNQVDLEAGTYFVKINKGSWGNTTVTYQLDTVFQAAENNEVEPNNGTEIAQLLTLNEKSAKGFLSWSDSEDYYKGVLPKAGQLKINISS